MAKKTRFAGLMVILKTTCVAVALTTAIVVLDDEPAGMTMTEYGEPPNAVGKFTVNVPPT